MAEISEIELALLEKKKDDLRAEMQPHLVALKNLIPQFTGKDFYQAQVQSVIDNLLNDSELHRQIITEQIAALNQAICMIDSADLVNLGLDYLCT